MLDLGDVDVIQRHFVTHGFLMLQGIPLVSLRRAHLWNYRVRVVDIPGGRVDHLGKLFGCNLDVFLLDEAEMADGNLRVGESIFPSCLGTATDKLWQQVFPVGGRFKPCPQLGLEIVFDWVRPPGHRTTLEEVPLRLDIAVRFSILDGNSDEANFASPYDAVRCLGWVLLDLLRSATQ